MFTRGYYQGDAWDDHPSLHLPRQKRRREKFLIPRILGGFSLGNVLRHLSWIIWDHIVLEKKHRKTEGERFLSQLGWTWKFLSTCSSSFSSVTSMIFLCFPNLGGKPCWCDRFCGEETGSRGRTEPFLGRFSKHQHVSASHIKSSFFSEIRRVFRVWTWWTCLRSERIHDYSCSLVISYRYIPIGSMYGIFTYIWVILLGQLLVNIPAPWSI